MNWKACGLLLLLLLPQSCLAGHESAKQDAASITDPKAYLLATDDVIGINVINFANLSVPQIIIPPDGKITVPLLDPILVTGKTTEEVAKLLAERWKKYVINPAISVTLIQKRKESILIYGFVTRVGTIEYRADRHILDVLAEAGGATQQGDLAHTVITHKSGIRQTLDLSRPETKGGTEVDITLEAGDVVYVPERRSQFSVVGEVSRPGSFDYRDDMTVMDALTAVGGVRDTADLAGATLQHADGKEERLDLEALLRRGDFSYNKKLAPGERIIIPEIRNRVYVFGAVARPGYYLFKDGDRILDALNGCGGPLHDGNLGKVSHLRINKSANTSKLQYINVDKFLKKGDLTANIALESGDIIFIPDKKRGFQVSDLWGLFSGVQLINGLGQLFGFSR